MKDEENDKIQNCDSCQQIIAHGIRMDEGNHTCGRGEEIINRLIELYKAKDLIESGYGGITPEGTIVDRRVIKSAIPFQENKLFNTPKPKQIK